MMERMTPAASTGWIRERALSLGFDLFGVVSIDGAREVDAPSGLFAESAHLQEWLARGYAGEMKYLRDPRRTDPRQILEGAKSIIAVAINYNSKPRDVNAASTSHYEPSRGWISRYAWGDDYHDVIREKLKALIAEMKAEFPGEFEARAYVDTGPILERVAAKYAGLGWLGKNTLLINSHLGSWLFLGVVVTTLDLEPTLGRNQAPPADLCGSCTRCLDACPTQAFPEPYVLDARRCISYLTIEFRGSIPGELRPTMGNAAIGCDICQDVCPWNRKAPLTNHAAFQPREIGEGSDTERSSSALRSLLAPELEWLASLSQEDFSAVFRRSAVKRARWRGLVRNACVALGNSGVQHYDPAHPRVVALLERLSVSSDPLIAEHAQWALSRLSSFANAAGGASGPRQHGQFAASSNENRKI
jgi:epoxyqueuosine reductase